MVAASPPTPSPTIWAVILAAGKGTRMRSDRAKVLHELAGRPLVAYPLAAAAAAGAEHVVVVTGHAEAQVRAAVRDHLPTASMTVAFAHQAQQLGTGHAVFCALPALPHEEVPVLVLSGDVPLLTSGSVARLVEAYRGSDAGIAFATFRPLDTTGYGRVERDADGRVVEIIEDRDCDPRQKAIDECNSGTYCIDARRLHDTLPSVGRDNVQGEMYLTDLVAVLARRGTVATIEIPAIEAAGVNTREQLAELEAIYTGGGS